MRPLSKVIDAALAIVPQELPERADFAFTCKHIKESIPYTAPEAIGQRWLEFESALNYHFHSIYADWTKTLVDMIADKIPYQQFLKEKH